MFAVIRTGGKQYRVAKDDIIAVEKLAGEPGDVVEFDEVLMVGEGAAVAAGTPLVAGAAVSATLVEQSRAAKIIVFKKKRRHNYRRKNGHRQYQTVVHIDAIRAAGFALPIEEEGSLAAGPAAEQELAAAEVAAVEQGPVVTEAPAVEESAAGEAEVPTEARPASEEGVSSGS
jgi:large subunit ribosomal protein L21